MGYFLGPVGYAVPVPGRGSVCNILGSGGPIDPARRRVYDPESGWSETILSRRAPSASRLGLLVTWGSSEVSENVVYPTGRREVASLSLGRGRAGETTLSRSADLGGSECGASPSPSLREALSAV
jgi:hypothetical protein